MRILEYVAAQGDLSIFEIDEIPKGLTEEKPVNGQFILAHSETGHHHVIQGNTVRVFNESEFVSFLDVKKPTEVRHLRSFDTHSPISLKGDTKYRITRQREYIPEGFRKAAD